MVAAIHGMGALAMPNDLLALFVLTAGTAAAGLAYVTWRHVSEAKPGRRWVPVAVVTGALAIGGTVIVSKHDDGGAQPATADSPAARFPGPWQDGFNPDITRALIGGSVRGCGKYAFRRDSGSSGEYLVYCQGAEPGWRAYLVWLPIGKVIGPLQPSADIPLPE